MKKIGYIYMLLIAVAVCVLFTGNDRDMFVNAPQSEAGMQSIIGNAKVERIQSTPALFENIYFDIQIAPSLIKNHVNDLFACTRSFEMLFYNKTLVELSHFQCIASKLNKIDVIFPFHYFW